MKKTSKIRELSNYIDGEMDETQKKAFLLKIHNSPEMKKKLSELEAQKNAIRTAYTSRKLTN